MTADDFDCPNCNDAGCIDCADTDKPITADVLAEIRAKHTAWTTQQLGQEEIKRMFHVVRLLLAESDRLRADAQGQVLAEAGAAFRETFGDVVVRGTDGEWANAADFIGTRTLLPTCDDFYPSHVDTRCYLPKGHKGSHHNRDNGRDLAWPQLLRGTDAATPTA